MSIFVLRLLMTSVAYAEIPLAVTIDDLPIHGPAAVGESRLEIARKMIEVFKRHGLVEVFGFVNSGKVIAEPASLAVLEAWREAGYPLGNHTFSHLDLAHHSAGEFLSDVDAGEALLGQIGTGADQKWFRFPFLHEGDSQLKRDEVRKGLARREYRIAQVTVDFEDWAWNTPYSRCLIADDQKAMARLEESYLNHAKQQLKRAEVAAKRIFGRPIAHVLLLHIGLLDARMLDRLLSTYERMGVRFVRLAEAQVDLIYSRDPKTTLAQGSTFLDQWIAAKKLRVPRWPRVPPKELETICVHRL